MIKKNLVVATLAIMMGFTFILLTANGFEDVNQCLVKFKSEWGKPCSNCNEFNKSYRVYFRNECYNKLDVKVAAQEMDKRWKTYTKLEVGYNDTIVAYACKGNGRYLYWVKKSGDTSIELPTDDMVSEMP